MEKVAQDLHFGNGLEVSNEPLNPIQARVSWFDLNTNQPIDFYFSYLPQQTLTQLYTATTKAADRPLLRICFPSPTLAHGHMYDAVVVDMCVYGNKKWFQEYMYICCLTSICAT